MLRKASYTKKPSFKNSKRCIIFNNGWYEWQRKDNKKIPYYHFSQTNYFAGLYNEIGCLILTRNSVDLIKHVHSRQPVLLYEFEIIQYLEGQNLFNSKANQNINFYQVSKDVNNSYNNNQNLIKQVDTT